MDDLKQRQRDISDRQRLGRAITLARVARGMTTSELAVRCDYSISLFSLIENGLRSCTPETLSRIAAVLEIPEDVLTGLATGTVGAKRLGEWLKAAV